MSFHITEVDYNLCFDELYLTSENCLIQIISPHMVFPLFILNQMNHFFPNSDIDIIMENNYNLEKMCNFMEFKSFRLLSYQIKKISLFFRTAPCIDTIIHLTCGKEK